VDKFERPDDDWEIVASGDEPSEVSEVRRLQQRSLSGGRPLLGRPIVGLRGLKHSAVDIHHPIELIGSPNLVECVSQALTIAQKTLPYKHYVELCADMHERSKVVNGDLYAVHDVMYSVKSVCSPVASIKLINDVCSSSNRLPIASAPTHDLYCSYASIASVSAFSITCAREDPNQDPSTQATVALGQIDTTLCRVSAFSNNQNSSEANVTQQQNSVPQQRDIVICSVCIPSVHLESVVQHKRRSWSADNAKQSLDELMRGNHSEHHVKNSSVVVKVAKSMCSVRVTVGLR